MPKMSTANIIKYAAYITENEGYVKRSDSQDNCTVDRIIDSIESDSITDNELNSVKDRVAQWLSYVNDDKQTGEYFENLRAEIVKPMIEETKIGLIASSFASFDRHKIYKIKNEVDKRSEYLGEEGDKITFTVSEHRLVKSGESKFKNGTSKYYLYKMKDDDGNIIMWFADHDCEFEFEHSDKATATITKLSIFNEVKQTNVSKLRFL